jgi:DNA polymerase I-like protein with 3'-5' exonuclease and polymerase domains
MELKPVNPLELNPPLKVTRITDQSGLELLKDFFARVLNDQGGVIGWDIETTPIKDYFFRRCRTIQFGNQTEQYVIDLLAFAQMDTPPHGLPASDTLYDAQGHYGRKLTPNLKMMLDVIRPVVCTKDFLKLGVNLGFEYMSFYWLFGMRTFNFFDCALVEKVIWAGAHSMKQYSFFSMEEMMARYFQVQINKELQESFTLDAILSDDQIAYAALDTRFPFSLRQIQTLILRGETLKGLQAKGSSAANLFKHIDPILTGDNLVEIAKIENDAVGAFQDMHIHGERIDRTRWLARVHKSKEAKASLIIDVLDPIFLPLVGSKYEPITDEQIEAATCKWKEFNKVTAQETQLKGQIRTCKKTQADFVPELEATMEALIESRKATKEHWKKEASELSKRRTKIRKLAAKCEGAALINYGSDAQLLKVLITMKGLKSLKNLDDEALEKYEQFPVMAAIRKYHGLGKEIGTYGDQWATEWKTKPCKAEGWLHPGDGRLHCVFNQYDAETGRSSSEQPNGQNLPQDTEVRSCFIADPPNESIRISDCCDADTHEQVLETYGGSSTIRVCDTCWKTCETHAEEYVIVTADMSGAELRIIAELAQDETWIGAFARKEDVHSVGTELLYEIEWPQETTPLCAYFKLHTPESVAANPKCTLGDPQRQKCKCPGHASRRNDNKSTNFLLAYGGGPGKLAKEIKKTFEQAKELMAIHEQKNPRIWAYLRESGNNAKLLKRSFDMFGRRRLFPEPTWERAKEKAKEDREEKLRYDDDVITVNKANFIALHNRKPSEDELWMLSHREPTSKEIGNAFQALHGNIERQGKNHAIQGTNATIAKLAMGSGYSPDGKPYLWHTLPLYRAMLIKFVHDELVVQCPKQYGEIVADLIGDAFKRAAAEKMKRVVMEFDYHIEFYWCK